MNVFISYSTRDDQVIALRLQTLASVYGFTAYVPPAGTRNSQILSATTNQKLGAADVVFAVINHLPSVATAAEVNLAVGLQKLVVPIVGQWVPQEVLTNFPRRFVLDPGNPAAVEAEILRFLKTKKADQDTKKAVLGLAVLATGLLLLSSKK